MEALDVMIKDEKISPDLAYKVLGEVRVSQEMVNQTAKTYCNTIPLLILMLHSGLAEL